ncbi:MAG: 30S ribosomal protein S20 [Candidatus Nealsonbacteria bacterium]|nr:30S ribosomal protein S20 [Candidatus Nealsonbacteria bacterium]
MAITASAKKALRQSERRKAQNSIYKNKIKKLLKQVEGFISAKKSEEAKNILPQVFKILDKGAKVGVIKKNTADRKKSRLAKAIAKSLK